MKISAKTLFKLFCLFFPAVFSLNQTVSANDLGVMLDQNVKLRGEGGSIGSDYSAVLKPRYSAFFGNGAEFHFSAGLGAEYSDKTWNFVPEVLRAELRLFFDNITLNAGRMHYSDPLGFIASGYFDGLRLFLDNKKLGTFSFGAWYTGFLFKGSAQIGMTEEERISMYKPLDYGDLLGTYFAPPRVVAALDWEIPSIFGSFWRGIVSASGQMDLEGDLNSQYLSFKFSVPVNALFFDLGGSFNVIQNSGELQMAFAGKAGISWTHYIPFMSRLSLTASYSSGVMEGGFPIYAFLPITTARQGSVLQAEIPGLTIIQLEYVSRLHRTLAASLTSTYFVRNDLGTYKGPISDSAGEGYFLGNEFFGQIFWSPFSDLSINAGGGAFLPFLGDAAPDSGIIWRAEINLTVSLY